MKRILLTGCQGQLGQELLPLLPMLGQVTAVGRTEVDLTQPDDLRQLIQASQPDVIVNAAAYTAVDRAESEPEIAHAVNATAPRVMAEEAAALGALFVHVSTDYVFDGQKNTPYLETDATHPLGVYGQSKLMGEQAIQEVGGRHLILRTAWVYSALGKGNFVKTMLRLADQREELKVVMDQVGAPTWAHDLADAIAQLVTRLADAETADPSLHGVYHMTNSGVTSWYDFAIAIFEEARTLGTPLKIQRVLPITTAEYPTPATRPAYSVLSTRKLASVLGTPPEHWRQSLRKMLAHYYGQTYESTDSIRR